MQNVGYGATRIIAIRHDGVDTSLVLDTNSFSLGMREEELPTDPFLLGESDGKYHEYSLLGNLCLESDIFFCRHVHLSRPARVWDIIIFPDIGAYHTDFYETESISHSKKSRYFQRENILYPDNF
jgi:diaminopimelate decarboxylase